MFGIKNSYVFRPTAILIVLVLVVLITITGFVSYRSVYNASINTLHQQNLALISRLEGWLDIKSNRVENNALLLGVMDMDHHDIIHYFGLQADIMEDIYIAFAGFPDGRLIFGGNWDAAYDVDVVNRPWYVAAAQNPGQVVFSQPYVGAATGQLVFAVARTVANHDDSLGVAAISLPFANIINVMTQENSYSIGSHFYFVLDCAGNILYHSDPELGPAYDLLYFNNIADVNGGRYECMLDAIQRDGIYASGGIVYMGLPIEATGWMTIVGVPTSQIIAGTMPVIASLIVTGVFALVMLTVTGMALSRIKWSFKKEREANEIYEVFVESSPFVTTIWNSENSIQFTSSQVEKLFGIDDKNEYLEHFHKFSPQYQPCGTPSAELAANYINKAFDSDKPITFEWMHQMLDGTPIPTEITLVRFMHNAKYLTVAYTIDMRAEKALLDAERDYSEMTRVILDSSPVLIEVWDDEYNVIDCNQSMLNVFESKDSDEYIRNYHNFLPEYQPCGTSSVELGRQYAKKALAEGSVVFEWMHKLKDGSPFPVEVMCVHVVRKGKSLLLSYKRDLRKIKRITAESQAASERANLMMRAAPVSCFIITQAIGLDGKMRFVPIDFNHTALDLFGFSDEAEIYSRFYDIFDSSPEVTQQIISKYTRQALEKGYIRFEFTHKRLDGEPVPCEVTIVRSDYQDEPVFICFHNDLRHFKSAIAKEIDAHNQTRMFLDAAPFFVEIWDKKFNLIDCNTSAVDMFGCTSRQDYIDNFYTLSAEPQPCGTASADKMRGLLETALRQGHANSEWLHITFNGEFLPVAVTCVHLVRDGEDIIVVYSQDLRQIKENLAKQHAAEQESQAKTQFLARMSHEIRTPMNSVLGITEIELQKDTHTKEAEEAFSRIYGSSRLLLNIINDILDLSKVEAGKMEIVPVTYDTASLIADTVQLNLMYMGNKQINFNLEIDESLPAHLFGDDLRIKQILNNILSNAFKYTTEGDVTLKFGLKPSPNPDIAVLAMHVTDSGRGISPEQLQKLFVNEFTRFNLEQNRTIEGHGLGMTITHSLVNLMDGSIEVDSELGRGSTFSVYIPQGVKSNSKLGSQAVESLKNFEFAKAYSRSATPIAHEPMPYGSVLVVDDVESNLYVTKGLLRPYKLDAEFVGSGSEAVNLVNSGKEYDIIFMDYMMPDMDGIETTQALRKMGYNAPIVALTANATIGASQMFMDNGFDGFISKPLDPSRLDKYLMEYVYAKQPPEVIKAARARHSKIDKDIHQNISGMLRESFLIDARKSITVLESIMQAGRLNDGAIKLYTIQTHAIKSALANINHTMLAETALTLEDAGRAHNEQLILSQTPKFIDELRQVVKSMTQRRKDDAPIINDNNGEFLALLKEVAAACRAYDTQKAQELLATMKQKSHSPGAMDIINNIESHLLMSDDIDAANVAEQAANRLANIPDDKEEQK